MIATYQKAFEELQEQLPGFADARTAAMADLELPGSRDEGWRFTSVRKLLGDAPAPMTGSIGALPAGVAALDATAPVGSVATLTGLVGLNFGLFREGAVIRESAALTLTTPAGLSTPRILIQAEAGAHLEVFLDHRVDGVAIPVVEVTAGAGATVSVTQLVQGSGSFAGHVAVAADENSSVAVQTVIAGGTVCRAELFVELGTGAHLDCSGLILGRERQHHDQHVEIHHAGADCTSSQVFRNIVDDRARAVFTGAVTVGKNIRGTDAQQTANSLLLSNRASAVARPWLEIHNEQVTASHGATVGRLDPDSLFYLQARGIPLAQARRLLTRAFAGEVVSTVPESYRAGIQDIVNGWLDA